MEESAVSTVPDGELIGIKFGLASHFDIRISSISDCPISHASQLANPFLGLPLEMGKCESCGTAEPGKCEGHFGYIELPIPIYHPFHISELKRILSYVCLKCLKMKSNKLPIQSNGVVEKLLSACCDEACHVSIKESKNSDGALFLELRIPARSRAQDSWNFLDRYGYRYGDGCARTLLPSEVLAMLRKLPEDTIKKLAKKALIPQEGYILRYVPVPPNCLSVPDISDGVSVMSSDLCSAMLKKVLRQIEVIRSSRSGEPNFESHEVEANDLQVAVSQYLQVRGTGKAARDGDNRYGVSKEGNNSSSKAWVDKMKTLFISKGSGFSSRSVITGDAYRAVNEVGVPCEIASKMTFEEKVNVHNIQCLQSLVDKNLCLTFRDGLSTYSLREGSKGHTFLRLGQVVHRRIMDGDIVFINRPPTTHKHSLQALRVYIHDDHVVKINPLMCGPLAADFDGDCVHLFYPQSLSARAEVLELFSVEKQLLSSHSGNLNLQLSSDSLLSLKTMFKEYFLDRASAQQLAMHAYSLLPSPALWKAYSSGPLWTAQQVLQTALPSHFDCLGDRLLIRESEVLKLDFNRDVVGSVISDVLTSLFFNKSPNDALSFFDALQPLLMENLFAEGCSVGLHDFFYPKSELQNIQRNLQDLSTLLLQQRSSYNELVQLQFESHIRDLKSPVANFILTYSALGNLIDSRSDSAVDKIVQQIGFLGLQLSDRRKFYSRGLVEDVASLFHQKYPFAKVYPSEEYGFVTSCFFHGLDPYEEIVHSIATREVIVRSSKGLAEPGTLFKNLMAVLRDVVICYDGTVRNISSNSIIQFEYGVGGMPCHNLFPAGEPVGVLAATAMSNPAYKAVLDSSPNSNSSWDMMKEILFCRANFRNDINDRRVILYLNDCCCGRKYCQENASCLVKNHLKKVSLRDAAVELSIEYKRPKLEPESCEIDTGLVGHIHLNAALLKSSGISMFDILQKCEEEVNLLRKKKKFGYHFKRILLSVSDCCFFKHSDTKWTDMPCLKFFWQELTDSDLERTKHIMADMICPVLLDTIIKGDPRISTVNIIWISPGTTTWVQGPCSSTKGELAVEVTLEKAAVRQSGDAWRIVLDCCLPVFHLVDTRRSIPYAIKQIQDLFGISCAFDQAVQRLSTSVTMVTKGVLKEHLLLLASSMTCAGNLVGFNTSGIKALCRALNVQVPFTEATLYTPRKCFERASEKCHVDTLTSIVGSCSWGKRVAIGTGAKFDILWDTKEIEMVDKPIDVYNFLHLVSSSNEEEIDTGCLGEDIESFDKDLIMEPALSPEQENKAVFEDIIDVGVDFEVPGTGDTSWDAIPSSGKGWDAIKTDTGSGSAKGSGWSSWGSKQGESQPEDSSKTGGWSSWRSKQGQSQQENSSKNGGLDELKTWDGSNQGDPSPAWGAIKTDTGSGTAEGSGWSSWGSKQGQTKPENSSKIGGLDESKTWDGSNQEDPTPVWDRVKETDYNTGWKISNSKKDLASGSVESGGWSSWEPKKDLPLSEDSSKANGGWEVPKSQGGSNPKESLSSWGAVKESDNNTGWQKSDGDQQGQPWGKSVKGAGSWSSHPASQGTSEKEENKAPFSRGQPKNSSWKNNGEKDGSWDSLKFNQQGADKSWNSKKIESNTESSWTQQGDSTWKDSREAKNDRNASTWNSAKANGSTSARCWSSGKANGDGATGSWGSQKEDKPLPSWGQSDNSNESGGGWCSDKVFGKDGSGSWDSHKKENKTQSSWGQPKKIDGCPGISSSWGSQKEQNPKPSSWGQSAKSTEGGSVWSSDKVCGDGGSGSWDSNKTENKTPSSWGQPKKIDDSPGVSSSWGFQKEQNPKPSSWGQSAKSTEGGGIWSSDKVCGDGGSGSWDSNKTENKTPSNWGQPKKIDDSPGVSSSWGFQKEDKPKPSSWGQSAKSNDGGGSWSSDKVCGEGGSGSWDSHKKENKTQSSWGQSKKNDGSPGVSCSWGSQKEDKPQPCWGQSDKSDEGGGGWSSDKVCGEGGSGSWEACKKENKAQSSWGISKNNDESSFKKSEQSADHWGSDKSNQPGNSSGWGSEDANSGKDCEKQDSWGKPNDSTWKKESGEKSHGSDDSQSSWGQPGGSGWHKKRPEGGRGWGSSNTGEWKSRKNQNQNQNRPPRGLNGDSTSVALTATRKRIDSFSAEEQDVLSEVESVMMSIRRIMHQSGCNDGEPLPPDDQTYMIDNVLNYHPDKAAKIGAGVDFLTVKKHSNFQETRCFYVVSTDGQNTDFSYIKCMETFVKEKYPSVADSFTSKYFSRKHRPGANLPASPSPGNPLPSSPSPSSPMPSSPVPPSI